jgi:hypothetical protein
VRQWQEKRRKLLTRHQFFTLDAFASLSLSPNLHPCYQSPNQSSSFSEALESSTTSFDTNEIDDLSIIESIKEELYSS